MESSSWTRMLRLCIELNILIFSMVEVVVPYEHTDVDFHSVISQRRGARWPYESVRKATDVQERPAWQGWSSSEYRATQMGIKEPAFSFLEWQTQKGWSRAYATSLHGGVPAVWGAQCAAGEVKWFLLFAL